MKRIIIICEGQTEQEFCKEVLSPYFLAKNIQIQAPVIKHSGGGIVHWKTLQKQIENHIKQDKAAKISMLIDYYGLKATYDFPKWSDCHKIGNKSSRLTALETAMKEAVDSPHFLPYIQLHEFEGLLFQNIRVFRDNFSAEEADFEKSAKVIAQFPNVEDINDSSKTAASKRLEAYIKGYNKPIFGALLAKEIGLTAIRKKAPRSDKWIQALESL